MMNIQTLSKIMCLVIGLDKKSEHRFSNDETIEHFVHAGVNREMVEGFVGESKTPRMWVSSIITDLLNNNRLIETLSLMTPKISFYNKNFASDIRDAVGPDVWDTAVCNSPVDKTPNKEPCIGRSAIYLAGDCPYYRAPVDKLFFIEVVQSVFGAGFVDFMFVNKMSSGDKDFFTMILNKCYRADKEKMIQVAILLKIPDDALYSKYS